MKKLSLITLFYSFIISANLYCFDLLDDVEDFFDETEDLAQIIGIIFMIFIAILIIRRLLIINERNTYLGYYDIFKKNDTENDLQEENIDNNANTKDGKENNSKYVKIYDLSPKYKLKQKNKKDNDIIIK